MSESSRESSQPKNIIMPPPEFKRVDFPTEAAERIKAAGGEPVMAMVYAHHGRVVSVIVSNDPSGPNGKLEAHASVAVSYFGHRQNPKPIDVRAAVMAIGWFGKRLAQLDGNGCSHLYLRD